MIDLKVHNTATTAIAEPSDNYYSCPFYKHVPNPFRFYGGPIKRCLVLGVRGGGCPKTSVGKMVSCGCGSLRRGGVVRSPVHLLRRNSQ